MVKLGPDKAVLKWVLMGVGGLLSVVTDGLAGVAEEGIDGVLDAAIEGDSLTASLSKKIGKQLVKKIIKEEKAKINDKIKDKLNAVSIFRGIKFDQPKELSKNVYEISAKVPQWDSLPELSPHDVAEDAEPVLTKAIVSALILECIAQSLMDTYEHKGFHLLQPGQTDKSGKKTLSLLLQYDWIRFLHEDGELQVAMGHFHVWTGAKNKSTKHYDLGGHSRPPYDNQIVFKLKCETKNSDIPVRALDEVRPMLNVKCVPEVRMSSCWKDASGSNGGA
jgi:hypothetical protein